MANRVEMVSDVTYKQVTVDKARTYEQRRFARKFWMRYVDEIERKFARKVFEKVGEQATILDVPCGSGRFFEIFAKAGTLIMVDYSPEMLQVVRERYGIHENVRLIKADVANMPIADNTANLCFCMRLIHHIPDDKTRLASLRELARVSRKYVALSFYNKRCLSYYWRKILHKKIRGNHILFTHIVALAKEANLEIVERFPKMGFVDPQCLVLFKKVTPET